MKQHIDDSLHNYSEKRYNQPIHCAIRKYGIENFQIDILEENIEKELIDIKEQYYINLYNTMAPNGYNLTEGGISNKTAPIESRFSQVFYDIVEELKTDKSLKEIANHFQMSYSYLSDINNGTRLYHENINYPIRKSSNNPDKTYYQQIVEYLQNTNLSYSKIAEKLDINKQTVMRANNGQIKRMKAMFPELTYPLRK